MKQFLLGALIASLVWAGVLWAQVGGLINLGGERGSTSKVVDAGVQADSAAEEAPVEKKRKGKGRRGKKGKRGGPGYETGEGTFGDDLSGEGKREMDLGGVGGERQLTGAQIDSGIDQVFNGIQRCLVLVPPGAPATGKVILGMRISGGGKVTAVNLSGPNDIIKGESGACIRRAVRSIEYPAFDGPEMTVRYPIIFD